MGVPEWMEEQRDEETKYWDDWDADTQALNEEKFRHLTHNEKGNRYPDAT